MKFRLLVLFFMGSSFLYCMEKDSNLGGALRESLVAGKLVSLVTQPNLQPKPLLEAFEEIGAKLGAVSQELNAWARIEQKMTMGHDLMDSLAADYQVTGIQTGSLLSDKQSWQKGLDRRSCLCGSSCFAESFANKYIEDASKRVQARLIISGQLNL